MKTISLALAATTVLSGCIVLPSPQPRVVAVEQPATVVYSPGYVVTTLPTGYRTVRYSRNVYYENSGVYYQRHRNGYVVVQRPY